MWLNASLDATENESLEKLDAAIRAHGPVFDALGRFVAAGHQLRFHWGNHDIDLIWPQVQARIRDRIARRHLHSAISFDTLYQRDGLYVIHGHQADPANSFRNEPHVIHRDPHGVPRLERCWGTRLVEEFYNQIETLEGCEMLDNVRPRMQAAIIIIKYAITHRPMHATLYAGMRVILDTFAQLHTEEDVTNAADQLGVRRQILSWLVSVAGWLGVRVQPALTPKSTGTLPTFAPSLQTAYAYGASVRDVDQLVQFAPPFVVDGVATRRNVAKGSGETAHSTPRAEYSSSNNQRYVQFAADIVTSQPDVQAVCLGHTHQALGPAVAIDQQPGWPLPATSARLFNSGSWTRTLDLQQLMPEQMTFEYLVDQHHYRLGRDYVRVSWPESSYTPLVETLAWG
jgi:UDP-2,3-diacylglucosamine pyrophosphatase LpxH